MWPWTSCPRLTWGSFLFLKWTQSHLTSLTSWVQKEMAHVFRCFSHYYSYYSYCNCHLLILLHFFTSYRWVIGMFDAGMFLQVYAWRAIFSKLCIFQGSDARGFHGKGIKIVEEWLGRWLAALTAGQWLVFLEFLPWSESHFLYSDPGSPAATPGNWCWTLLCKDVSLATATAVSNQLTLSLTLSIISASYLWNCRKLICKLTSKLQLQTLQILRPGLDHLRSADISGVGQELYCLGKFHFYDLCDLVFLWKYFLCVLGRVMIFLSCWFLDSIWHGIICKFFFVIWS